MPSPAGGELKIKNAQGVIQTFETEGWIAMLEKEQSPGKVRAGTHILPANSDQRADRQRVHQRLCDSLPADTAGRGVCQGLRHRALRSQRYLDVPEAICNKDETHLDSLSKFRYCVAPKAAKTVSKTGVKKQAKARRADTLRRSARNRVWALGS